MGSYARAPAARLEADQPDKFHGGQGAGHLVEPEVRMMKAPQGNERCR